MAGSRLFWAINLPLAVQRELAQVQAILKPTVAGAKWVQPQNLHLTVKFLGNVPPNAVPRMLEAVTQALSDCSVCHLQLGGWGTFGRPPRVLWTRVSGDVQTLNQLARKIEQALVPLAFAPENKTFKPHLTLARFRGKPDLMALRKTADQLVVQKPCWGEFVVRSIDLVCSTLTPKGPVYEVWERLELVDEKKGDQTCI